MPAPARFWKMNEIRVLREHPSATAAELAALLSGRSASAIKHKRHEIYVARRKRATWTPEKLATLARRRAEGATLSALASELGVSVRSVCQRLADMRAG